MNESKTSQFAKGLLLVHVPTLRRLLIAKAWTVEDFSDQTGITKRAVRKMLSGGPSRMSTLQPIAQELGVDVIDLVDPIEYQDSATIAESNSDVDENFSPAFEWLPGRPLSDVRNTSNGLQYRIFRMQHRHQPMRFGRGKRYEFAHLPNDAQDQLKDRLVRHTEVCDLLIRHEQFPICYATFPESPGAAWWVVDEWVDGRSLAERLQEPGSPVPLRTIACWALQLANAVTALHDAGVIRRELSPINLHVRASDELLMLTDFELAKLSGNLPTVSSNWPDDPYRAPEIGAGEPTAAADVYSWGRIVSHLLAGSLPERGNEPDVLGMKVPQAVREVVVSSTALRQSQRPAGFGEVLSVLQQWQQSLAVGDSDGT